MQQSIIIIGGGAVGCTIAYELSKGGLKNITLLERNGSFTDVNQSMRNAGVIHSGIYYPKGSEPLKARLCVEGNALLYEFCRTFGVPHKNAGKLVIAANPQEEECLDYLLTLGKENGVSGLRKIAAAEMKKMEPNVSGRCALLVPSSGVVDLLSFLQTLVKKSRENGATCIPNASGIAIQSKPDGFEIDVEQNSPIILRNKVTKNPVGNSEAGWDPSPSQTRLRMTYYADMIINAAGLYSDEIAKMVNPLSPFVIEPVRGELACFVQTPDTGIGMNIYQAPYGYYNDSGEKAAVPLAQFHELMEQGLVTRTVGVHLTPTFGANGQLSDVVAVGPLKTVGRGKEDYTSGTKPMEKYIEKISHFFPNLKPEDLKLKYTGIMAVLPKHRDFIIERDKVYPNCINCIGIDSPGLTASLAIGRYVKELIV